MSNRNFWHCTVLAIGAFAAVALSACTPSTRNANDPKQRLTDYVSLSFSVRSTDDKAKLLEFLTGEAKTRLEAWSPEQFQLAFLDTKRDFVKLAFKEVKPFEKDKVNITYEITYLTEGPVPEGGKFTTTKKKILNKKMAEMVQVDGRWQISDVRTILEVLEFQNEMALSPKKEGAPSL